MRIVACGVVAQQVIILFIIVASCLPWDHKVCLLIKLFDVNSVLFLCSESR